MIGFVSRLTMNKIESDNNDSFIEPGHLAELLLNSVAGAKVLIVDCRRFLDYNMSHIQNSINICCSKLVRRRLQDNKMSAAELLYQQWLGLVGDEADKQAKKQAPNVDVILYDEKCDAPTVGTNCTVASSNPSNGVVRKKSSAGCDDVSFIAVMMEKLYCNASFNSVRSLKGGFADFQIQYPELCEGPTTPGATQQPQGGKFSLASLSQPCLPMCNHGPTKILPFVYLGSLQDAMDAETLKKHGITYILNMSVGCPKPEFIQEEHFLRIPVNDNYSEKILPHFEKAFDFLNKVREANGVALVHCLAGISRSPTLAIAYVMSYLHVSQEEAYRYVKEKRPSISPNFNFLGQLLEYEKQLKTQRHRELFAEQKVNLLQDYVRAPTVGHRKLAIGALITPDVALSTAPSTEDSSTAAESFKRSFSCPVKIQKGPNNETTNVDAMDFSPANVINVNGKRRMEPKTDPLRLSSLAQSNRVITLATSSSCASRAAFITSGLSTVREDLPSPSQELSKLSFESDPPFPFSPPMSVGSWSSDECNIINIRNSLDNCCDDNKIQTDCYNQETVSSAQNPFFEETHYMLNGDIDIDSELHVRRSRSTSASKDSTEPYQKVPCTTIPALCAENPLFNPFISGNFTQCQKLRPKINFNPVSPINGFINRCSVPSINVEKDDTLTLDPNSVYGKSSRPKHVLWTTWTQRFRHLLNNKRASWPHVLPYITELGSEGQTAAALMLMNPDVAGSLESLVASNPLGPTKSKSESAMMYKLCDGGDNSVQKIGFPDLDSPESGFHSSFILSDTTSSSGRGRRDADRDSLGSSSSLEITAVR